MLDDEGHFLVDKLGVEGEGFDEVLDEAIDLGLQLAYSLSTW